MIKLIELAVSRPTLTFAIFAALLIAGVVSLGLLPIDFLPDITLPVISVITTYPSSGSFDVEKLVTQTLEEALSAIPNVKDVTSYSQENISVVTVTFNWGTDLDAAAGDIRDALDRVSPYLPDEAEKPVLFKFDVTQMPILIMAATTERKDIDLREIVDKDITPELAKIDGVGSTIIFSGGQKKQINVIVDKSKLDGYGFSIQNVVDAIRAENVTLPAGEIEIGKKSYLVRVPADIKQASELEGVVVGLRGGKIIRLSDIATVVDSYAERINYMSVNKKPGVMFGLYKRSGANTVKVSSAVIKRIRELEEKYPGVKINVIVDTSDFIKKSVGNLATTVFYAAILVILVTLLLIGRFDSGLIISSTIPISLIVVFLFLYIKGSTINMISLSAIAISIGMVVDNAIVVLENIFYHRQKGESPRQSAIFGAQEVSEAILASTTTTVVIFLPLLIVKGLVGVLFRELAWAVPITISISLFSALTLTPMMGSKLIFYNPQKVGILERLAGKFYNLLENSYEKILTWALKHKKLILLFAFLFFVAGVLILTQLKTEFFPESDENRVIGTIEMPLGTSLESTWRLTDSLQSEIIELVPEAIYIGCRAGRTDIGLGAMMGMAESPSKSMIILRLVDKDKRKRSSKDIAEELNRRFKNMLGVKKIYFTTQQQGGAGFMGMGKAISVEIYGDDILQTDSVANKIEAMISGIRGATGILVSREPGEEEIQLLIDRDRARTVGLVPAAIASYVRSAIYGVQATSIRRGGSDIAIFVQLDSLSRKNVETLENLMIPTPTGKFVPLANLCTIHIARSPLVIERKNKMRYVRVECDLAGISLGEFTRELNAKLKHLYLPQGVSIKVAGQAKDQAESFSTLLLAFIVGVLLVYLVMAAQFESFLDPFIIIFSVPAAVTGVALAFLITGVTFSVMSFVGLVMLVGIVVNNAIVLVDYMNILRWRGHPLDEVIVMGAKRRLRPVLMTTLTTIFGLIPLALSKAQGSELWNPLGISVIGGLFVSTFITLVLVPVIYSIVEKRLKRILF